MAGIIKSITNEEYHGSEGYSSSQLKDFLSNPPAFFKAKYIDKSLAEKDSTAFAMGTAVHTMFLEPELVSDTIAVMPVLNLRTKDGKRHKEEFLEMNEGKTILKAEEWDKCLLMIENLNAVPAIKNTKEGSTFEDSIYWTDEETGLQLKIRPDILNKDKNFIGDLKTCQKASLRGFGFAIRKFKYQLSAAMYLDGMKSLGMESETFIWPIVESEPPYLTAIYVMSPEMLAEGHQMYRTAVTGLAEAIKTGVWNGYNDGQITVIGEPE